jgi:hypothetical protein
MVRKVKPAKVSSQHLPAPKGDPVYPPETMVDTKEQLDAEWRAARANFRGWLFWYLNQYPERWPTQKAMADDLGITEGRLSQLLAPDPTEPKLRVLLAAKRAFRSSIDHLLTPPPEGVAKK